MFGHQDDETQQATGVTADAPSNEDADDRPSGQPSTPEITIPSSGTPSPVSATAGPAKPTAPPQTDDQAWQHPGTPIGDKEIKDIISPAGGFPKRPTYQYPLPGSSLSIDSTDETISELIEIKQHALGELAPLIDQLNLNPEEKFRTIMMVIQASDDESMVKAAYAAAHSIKDEKARAQALLDIINEVNYFTRPSENDNQ